MLQSGWTRLGKRACVHAASVRSLVTRPRGAGLARKVHRPVYYTDLDPVRLDLIGTPDPVSNLRPVKYYIDADESAEEKEWRLLQQSVDRFNQDFWAENNRLFQQAKHDYEDNLRAQGQAITPEALSIFYNDFLAKSRERHMQYNLEWMKLNFRMLYPGFKACVRQFRKRKATAEHKVTFWDKNVEF
ncbi:hypothetical protein BZG36_02852 [Bifiguratus adelaidae]|uniref:Apoptogenic protein 1, mitochondrial n=1 Tax=Bifiguratus adelaidae TaxID=1938954 RepID=A0A261Y0H1_9FUNG|nr:hypothetical protein BZG36_02852 [Bifiguratus adelaidae]